MKGMQVCVTGANGFIGRRLVDALFQQGYSIRVLTRRPDCLFPSGVQVVLGDLVTPDSSLDQFLEGCEIVFHCAGEIRDTATMRLLHVDGTRRLLRSALRESAKPGQKIHWVQLSSVGVYGTIASGALTENSELNPVAEYEITKAESDQIIIGVTNADSFTFSILRPSNVFGAEMTNQSLFGMVGMIDRGLFFFIGKPGVSANYVHVDNVVDGLLRCGTMQCAKNRVYNLSDHCTLERFVNVLAARLGRAPPWLRIPETVASLMGMTLGRLPGFPLTQSRVRALVNRSIYPISRIQDELGYHHVISMEDGLLELVDAYRTRFTQGPR